MFLGTEASQGTEKRERGSALTAVVAVMGITMVIALVIGGVTVNALSTTTATRAATQAEAAAHAGIDSTVVSLLNGTCPTGGTYPLSASEPIFQAQVSVRSTTTGAYLPGCPGATTVNIKVVATGTASARGVVGSTAGDRRKVEAIFAAGPGADGGAAIYSYNAGILNTAQITAAVGAANVQVKIGDVSCNSSSIQGGISTANGIVNMESSCSTTGDVNASGTVKIAGKVGGSVTALGSVNVVDSGRVAGGIKTAGDIADDNGRKCGTGGANAEAACYLGTIDVAWPSGPNAPTVRGAILFRQSGMVAPAVPNWQDFEYVPNAWSVAGWVPGGGWNTAWCNVDNTSAAAVTSYLNGLTQKTVINVSGCASGKLNFSSSAALRLNLKTDVAFIAPSSLGIENVEVATGDGQPHQISFLTPDMTTSVPPLPSPSPTTCKVDINSSVKIVPPIAALIYTPCTIENSTNTWTGQFYSGKTNLNSAVSFAFVPVTVPGLNLSGAVAAPSAIVGNVLNNRVSLRDLDG